jgi:hypothetical protein
MRFSMDEPKKEERVNGCYVNWEAIRNMTEEEAEEAWVGFHETFTGRDVRTKKDENERPRRDDAGGI